MMVAGDPNVPTPHTVHRGAWRMYLSGLTHRDRLFDVASRWLADHPQPDDGRIVTEIFAFERAVTAPTVRRLVADLCRTVWPEELYLERFTSKDQVREAIAAAAAHPSTRVAELIDWYRQLPEEFFPRTPVQMSLVTRRTGRLAALVRRKRMRRIADKVSRLVAARLTGEVATVARTLASSRPRHRGMEDGPGNDRAAPPAGVIGAAERLVADRIRSGRLVLEPEPQRVDDVIGVKLIGRDEELARMEAKLDELEYTWAFHREVRDGPYVGTHILVDLELPPVDDILATMHGIDWRFAHGRGLDPSALESTFRDYVDTGSRTFQVELILTTFEDLVESEFGRCIHEQRILDQRSVASDFDRLATNASWLIEYMLRLAISPTVAVGELPIKLWGRYIRDTVAHAIDLLDGDKPSEWLVPDEHLEDLLSL